MVSSLVSLCVFVYLCLLSLRQCICRMRNAYDQCLMRASCKLMCMCAQNICAIAIYPCCGLCVAATGSVPNATGSAFLAYPTL